MEDPIGVKPATVKIRVSIQKSGDFILIPLRILPTDSLLPGDRMRDQQSPSPTHPLSPSLRILSPSPSQSPSTGEVVSVKEEQRRKSFWSNLNQLRLSDLKRKDLQTVCKKNKIPASVTNVAMADAVQSIEIVEGLEEFLKQSSLENALKSPENQVVTYPRVSQRHCMNSTSSKEMTPYNQHARHVYEITREEQPTNAIADLQLLQEVADSEVNVDVFEEALHELNFFQGNDSV
ncbi:hypothetical protein Nepgr_021516 [Nepenthes gracilis]|uniref:Uncharacterized protein n=1 Tax=Nepenthes gracilis TaxID=150966 RepID=A0AAD3SYS2_NEPGR|nr:hypothetical protein Nepgr_021516 [Nepenthes gracilis]